VFEDQIGIYIIHKDWFKRYIHTEKFVLEEKQCDNTIVFLFFYILINDLFHNSITK
jgi:hypothetical protein